MPAYRQSGRQSRLTVGGAVQPVLYVLHGARESAGTHSAGITTHVCIVGGTKMPDYSGSEKESSVVTKDHLQEGGGVGS